MYFVIISYFTVYSIRSHFIKHLKVSQKFDKVLLLHFSVGRRAPLSILIFTNMRIYRLLLPIWRLEQNC